jgi:heptosyltransferase-2
MKPRSIFVRSPNWVGDAVMATPALRALRESHPDAEIVLEARPLLAGVLRGLSSFDELLIDDGASAIARARALRARRFDWAVLLPDSVRVAIGPFLARIPRRVGYARDLVRRALLTDALAPPREGGRRLPVSMIERYLAITRRLGCADRGSELDLRVDPQLADQVNARLGGCGVRIDDPILVVTPGARFGSSKLWPPDHFAVACDGIARRLGLLPVFAPAPDEIAIADSIAARMKERSLVLKDPPSTIEELKALVGRCALALTNDAGPRHIAVALSRPVVVVMGPTDPRHTAHHLERQRVLREEVECSPCHLKTCPIDHRCMTRLLPERAVAAAEDLLA